MSEKLLSCSEQLGSINELQEQISHVVCLSQASSKRDIFELESFRKRKTLISEIPQQKSEYFFNQDLEL